MMKYKKWDVEFFEEQFKNLKNEIESTGSNNWRYRIKARFFSKTFSELIIEKAIAKNKMAILKFTRV